MEFAGKFGRGVVKSWIDHEELYAPTQKGDQQLLDQTMAIANLPMMFHHVALMPDAHAGFGMPIGGVLALEGAICPAAVGYDIGCGMYAFKTDIPREHFNPVRVQVNRAVKKQIPVGMDKRSEKSQYFTLPDLPSGVHPYDAIFVNKRVEDNIEVQMGTLGSGNHFIEFDVDADDNVWVVIHSGSRGVGHAIAEHYIKMAEGINAKWWSKVPKDLACLPVDSEEGHKYEMALRWALDYARVNRVVMGMHIMDVLTDFFGDVEFTNAINVHHNDATIEHHFDRDVWVHRKGATRARAGKDLVIPGNMGQGTAICTGLGNPDSFCSSSHGAGRKMGRNEAKRTLDLDECKGRLDALDVVLSAGRDGALDEMPEAYKDFDAVMEAQSDLVEVTFRLHPLSVIKG